MKKLLTLIGLAFGFMSHPSTIQAQETTPQTAPKILIAYYSRKDENYFNGKLINIEQGNTEIAAKKIANIIGADLFKIEQ